MSASLGEDAAIYGVTPESLNTALYELCANFLKHGSRLCFGHDWRPGGVMSPITDLAVSLYENPPANRPCIQNFVHAETKSEMSPEMAEKLSGIIKVHELEHSPDIDIEEFDCEMRKKIALITMRRQLAEAVDGAVCLGGKWQGHSGWVPGILEEVMRNLSLGHPVFLCASFGEVPTSCIGGWFYANPMHSYKSVKDSLRYCLRWKERLGRPLPSMRMCPT